MDKKSKKCPYSPHTSNNRRKRKHLLNLKFTFIAFIIEKTNSYFLVPYFLATFDYFWLGVCHPKIPGFSIEEKE